jgi:hypothetical protein
LGLAESVDRCDNQQASKPPPMKKSILSLLIAVGLIGSASAQTPTGDLTNGLVSFYSFNGNYNDSVGGNNFTSTTSGASFTTGRFGNPNSA